MGSGKKTPRLRELETVVVLAAFLLGLGLSLECQPLEYAALALIVVGLFVTPAASLISRLWLGLAELLGAFNSRVLLSLLFYLLLTPLALLFRLFSKNPLGLKRQRGARTLFLERNHRYSRGDFEKMW